MRVVQGDAAGWSVSDYLLAHVVDVLNMANWQRGGGKGSRPKPLQRPGTEKAIRQGKTDRAPQEVAAYLARFAPPKGGDD